MAVRCLLCFSGCVYKHAFFLSSRRRHTRCAVVTGVQTCALPIWIADAVEAVAALPDPVGAEVDRAERPNGLVLRRVRVPLGVIGILSESRPNVTADAAALGLMSGNGVIPRGGREGVRSTRQSHAAPAARLSRSARRPRGKEG